jgi:colanic acid/amylovoran biosynthesis protein
MFKTAILGTHVSSGNRGVRALGASLIGLCATAADASEIVLMLGHHDSEPVPFRAGNRMRPVRVVNCRLSPKAHPRDHLAWIVLAAMLYRAIPVPGLRRVLSRSTPWIATLEKTDIVGDVRGGDSFSDIYGIRRFLHGFFMAWTVLLVKGTIVQFPQTFGPYRSRLSRMLAGYILKRSAVIMARDEKSLLVARDLVAGGRDVWLVPDVAFSLEAVPPERLETDPPFEGAAPQGVIGLNVNGLMYNGGYSRDNMFGLKLDYRAFLPRLVEALLSEHPGELWLIPHTYASPENVESDPEACRRVRGALPEPIRRRVRIVTGEYDQHELKWLIGRCDFFIGSRMHSCIAALSQGVPCVGVAYSRKFQGVFDTVGMGGWVVEGQTVVNQDAVTRVLNLYRRRDGVTEKLRQEADGARKALQDAFRRVAAEVAADAGLE